jgi:hypothetical protein
LINFDDTSSELWRCCSLAAASVSAEDGYRLWLRYDPVRPDRSLPTGRESQV